MATSAERSPQKGHPTRKDFHHVTKMCFSELEKQLCLTGLLLSGESEFGPSTYTSQLTNAMALTPKNLTASSGPCGTLTHKQVFERYSKNSYLMPSGGGPLV